ALLRRLLAGGGDGGPKGLRAQPGVQVFLDHDDLVRRDLIIAIGFDHLECTDAVREYAQRGITVYERSTASIYSRRMLDSFGIAGAVRVSPLHCHTPADVDRFLAATQDIARAHARAPEVAAP
ncbi:hypothetical protein, partial [Raoultella sp. 18098]